MKRRDRVALAVVLLVGLAGCGAASGILSLGQGPAGLTFENATAGSGLDYRYTSGNTGNGNSGVYALDYDRDGRQDLLAVGGERPVLYRNTGGGFERSDALPAFSREFKSAALLDVEGDGWSDLLLFSRGGEVVSLRNREGTFEPVDYGFGNLTYPLGAAAADYDGDGDDDLFVYQSGNWREKKPKGYFSLYRHVEEDNGNPNYLYENTGSGFERVEDAGISGNRWSLAASFVDLTGDGLPDVHVANDYNNDTVYLNQGDGTFEQRLLGGATARNGMASEVADVTGSRLPEVFVTNIYLPFKEGRGEMSRERYERLKRFLTFVIHSGRTKGNTLLVNEGGGKLVDRADEFGVRHGGWGWAASFADLDNDGDRDLIHTTQKVVRIDPDDPKWTLPQLWRHRGDSFERVNKSVHGMAEHDSRGMVTIDYDGDGDLDPVIATYAGRLVLYENTVDGGNALAFRVVEEGATALGATVTVEFGEESTRVLQSSNTDFLSQEPRVEHVGVGSAKRVTLRVTWPDGTERVFEDVSVNRRVRITKDGIETVRAFDG